MASAVVVKAGRLAGNPWLIATGACVRLPATAKLVGQEVCIPGWYHYGMSKQIAVRLDDELVDFVDAIVDSGTERSRAAVVTHALERERRRMVAARDAEILASGPDPQLVGLAEHAAGVPIDR